MKVLIIEDDQIQAISLKLILNKLGFNDIVISHTGKDSLELCAKERFTHIFCDIQLPDTDGIIVLNTISNKQQHANVIILSSSDQSVIKLAYLACKELKFNNVNAIQKPFASDDISKALEVDDSKPKVNIQASQTHLFTEEEVIKAVENGEIFYFYQPQVNFKSNIIVGVEALIRWDHPTLGILTPNHFMPYINERENYNLLFHTVLHKSVRAIQSLNLSTPIKLSINLTQRDLECSDICNEIIDTCKAEGFNYHNLVLELTESHIYSADSNSLINLARLKMLGVKFAIDDFGIGYSSLQKITQIPFDTLKIDRCFVRNMLDDFQHALIVKLCIGTAKALQLNVVVEGVEDEVTWQCLKDMDADECQGYFTGRPMSIHALKQELMKQKTQTDSEQLNVLIVDEQPILGTALKNQLLLNTQVESVHRVTNSHQALNHIRDTLCNLLIVNLPLTNEDDAKIIEKIDSSNFNGRVIFISEQSDLFCDANSHIIDAGYISNTLELDVMVENILNFAHKNTLSAKNAASTVPLDALSKRELEVLKLLIEGVGNKAIANQLSINVKTVSTYKYRLLEKLNVKSLVELLKYHNF
ncbi:hypothetical protein BCU68_03910 [Vibrio sp. 10N.286.49.B3]|uniref:EAL domain-containing protein n=1 Tax=Vibrio sp. 10N.286.49.B3 TaxID=1880855 RepID=UPI000C852235|nr:EAL domain-containing protein [Vibrio sp. 10N.286.49.B3]PMH43144.1 hypothetical protein BCU68_03910 [Vibrio sp. 10N.286.49.B3]